MYNPADILNNVISYCINIYCILVYSHYLLRYWVSVVRTYLVIFMVASPCFCSRRLSGVDASDQLPLSASGIPRSSWSAFRLNHPLQNLPARTYPLHHSRSYTVTSLYDIHVCSPISIRPLPSPICIWVCQCVLWIWLLRSVHLSRSWLLDTTGSTTEHQVCCRLVDHLDS